MRETEDKTRNDEAALEEYLAKRFANNRRMVELKRSRSEYSSSFAIEDVKIVIDGSTTIQLVFKNLGGDGLLPQAKVAKPHFIRDPMREICTYTELLSSAGLGTATCFGSVADPLLDRYWLFLEKVEGVELYQIGDLRVWQRAAEWLAQMHGRLDSDLDTLAASCRLLTYDSLLYRLWLSRARRFCVNPEIISWVAARYDQVIERLLSLPRSFMHGEFYASNVIVSESGAGLRVVPIDWEMAAVGPSLIDLAALTAGKWSEAERQQIATAYWEASSRKGDYRNSFDEFRRCIDYCRLHLCIQWLGWAPQWSPPKEHANDWLNEAIHLVTHLGIRD
jgi:hypothetical protein